MVVFTAEAPLIKQEQQYTDEIDIQWALDLLKPDPNHKLSVMQTYIAEGMFVGSGFAIGCFKNYMNKRPFLAGIQFHVTFMVAGYVLSQVANKLVDKYKADRDTRLRNYLMLHPELFHAPKRAKYSDLFEPWQPIR